MYMYSRLRSIYAENAERERHVDADMRSDETAGPVQQILRFPLPRENLLMNLSPLVGRLARLFISPKFRKFDIGRNFGG